MLTVAIVGKSNVGKSSLFNRLISQKKSIVSDAANTTRDRVFGNAFWLNKVFNVIDTGGLATDDLSYKKNIELQVKFAIEQSDLILFLVSTNDQIDSRDIYVSKLLKKYKSKKIILVNNKIDRKSSIFDNYLYNLGFGKWLNVSAAHAIGIGDLLDEIIKIKPSVRDDNEKNIKFCIIGRTNVGKSTLLNAIVNKERSITSHLENTTRDLVDDIVYVNRQKYTIIDTAGIRKPGRVKNDIEKYAILRAKNAINKSQITLLVLDCSRDFTEQDEIIGGLAFSANIPTIICVNKWDIIKKNQKARELIYQKIRDKFKYLNYAPIIFLSALLKERISLIFSTIENIREELKIKISTSILNKVINDFLIINKPPKFNGGRIDISYATQIKGQVPSFVIFTNDPKYLHFTFARSIENQIRIAFNIKNVPIKIYYKDKNSRTRSE